MDFLDVNGDVELTGDLVLTFLNEFENTASNSDTFVLLTANTTIIGVFDNVAGGNRLLTADGLGSFAVNYGTGSLFGSNEVVLSDFQRIPEPSAWIVLAVGHLWVLTRRRRLAA